MKIAIGYRVREGPWGGGNRFAAALIAALRDSGHGVVDQLDDRDIDIILVVDPRRRNPSVTFTPGAILRYLARHNPNAIVVQRVNECDERKNTKTVNLRLKLANYCADHTVFVGSWLTRLPTWRSKDPSTCSVILNGSDKDAFHPEGQRPWDGRGPLRLVTHHWGGNWMKGFDIYRRLDGMLTDQEWAGRIEFTYVGNVPPDFRFVNARHVQPLGGRDLADELRRHHVYLTASIKEPGSHHQNEGALCGLPILYRNSGCLPEYCDGFGVMFGPESFEDALQQMMVEYDDWRRRMVDFPHDAARSTAQYVALFESLVARRAEIRAGRRIFRNPLLYALNCLPL